MINQLLARWASVQPEVCKPVTSPNGNYYAIEGYEFWQSSGEFYAKFRGDSPIFRNYATTDWLLGCVIRAIEAHPDARIQILLKRYNSRTAYEVQVFKSGCIGTVCKNPSLAESLLTAYVEYLEAGK